MRFLFCFFPPLLHLIAASLLVQGRHDDYYSIMLNVMSGGSAKFTGEMKANRVGNMASVFGNAVGGSIE